ncbi:pqsA [Symbiodinium sp. CCMP2592]|nr:pqsA [Symbiodinium sp. CCMP2592]
MAAYIYMLKRSGSALPEPGKNPCLVMKLLHTRHCLMTYNGGPYTISQACERSCCHAVLKSVSDDALTARLNEVQRTRHFRSLPKLQQVGMLLLSIWFADFLLVQATDSSSPFDLVGVVNAFYKDMSEPNRLLHGSQFLRSLHESRFKHLEKSMRFADSGDWRLDADMLDQWNIFPAQQLMAPHFRRSLEELGRLRNYASAWRWNGMISKLFGRWAGKQSVGAVAAGVAEAMKAVPRECPKRLRTETENILSAARKLLSVTCDCCEKLSHEWDIVEPTQRVLELLRYPGARKGEKPPTLSMRQCIALSDQDRFSTFVSSSGEDNNTATSLHLRMKDFSGKAFDAQLFHVNVPSLLTQHPQHLVGIIATSRHNDAIPSIPEGGVLSGVPESASDSRSQSACSEVSLGSRLRSAWVADAASLEWQVLTAKFQDWLDSVDHVELTLDLSTGSEGYAVRRATVHLKEVAPGEDPGTTLYSIIKPKYQIVVEDWISEHMNSWYHGIPCDEHCLGIKINLPMLGSVLVGDMAVSSIKEREHEEELHLEMAVELRNFLKATGSNARESGP